MAITILLKRGTTDANNRYTGQEGEITLDLQAKNIRMHDGVTPGGIVMSSVPFDDGDGDGFTLPSNLGPGPQTLLAGDATNGFFGELPASEFFSSSVLHNNVLTNTSYEWGTITEINDAWLKFVIDGKILYTPKKFLSYGVTWESLYHNGAVYGTGDNGSHPPPSGTRTQDCTVSGRYLPVPDSNQYKVRLFKGAEADPSIFDSEYLHVFHENKVDMSEWNRTIMAVHEELYDGVTLPKLAHYTAAELGFVVHPELPDLGNGAAGVMAWCQEATPDYSSQQNRRVHRGLKSSPDYFFSTPVAAENWDTIENFGWRPVLELIQ